MSARSIEPSNILAALAAPGSQLFECDWAVQAEDAPRLPNALYQTGTAEFPALSLGDLYRPEHGRPLRA